MLTPIYLIKKSLKPNFSCSIWNVLKVTSYWMVKMRKYVNTLAIARAQMSFFFFFFQIVLTLAPCKYWINCSRILLKGYHRIPSSIAGCFFSLTFLPSSPKSSQNANYNIFFAFTINLLPYTNSFLSHTRQMGRFAQYQNEQRFQ